MIWDDIKQELADRLGEPELFAPDTVDQEWDSPYFDAESAEDMLYEACLDELLDVNGHDLVALGSAAVVSVDLADGATMPTDIIEIIGAAIRLTSSDAYLPATYVSPVKWYQMFSVEAEISTHFTITGGVVKLKGNRLRLVYKRAPELSEFQGDDPVLPDGVQHSVIDRARKLTLIEDFMPRAEI